MIQCTEMINSIVTISLWEGLITIYVIFEKPENVYFSYYCTATDTRYSSQNYSVGKFTLSY